MKKSLLAKIASVGLGLSMICGGISAKDEGVSEKSRSAAMALEVFDLCSSLGFINWSYLYQGKPWKSIIFNLGPISSIYNLYHLSCGTQTDGEGKLIKKN